MEPEPEDVVEQLLERQPTRRRQREPRRFDRTQLRAAHHGRQVHRDYAAHYFRWGWATREMGNADRVLDVGCGQDVALAHVLMPKIKTVPALYLGVDLNVVPNPPSFSWCEVWDQFDFVSRWSEIQDKHPKLFTKLICFEVLEHMGVADGYRLLEGLREMMAAGAFLYLSTPVFNGKAAANHVHEYTVDELRTALEQFFTVQARYGTYASVHELRPVLAPAERELWERLRTFHGDEVMSTFLAPLYPDHSRNNLWVLTKKGK